MSINPIITFKAGQCEIDTSSKPYKVKPSPEPGYIYLYSDDDLIHFCWRPRTMPITEQVPLDLVMVPTDGHFVPYEPRASEQATGKTNGRIFVLKFESSSQRHIFWLQSKPQGRSGDPAWLSPRDRKIGEIVDRLLQGEEVDVNRELAQVKDNTDDSRRRDHDSDETMEDVEGHGNPDEHHEGGAGAGGAGPDATGGDFRSEGEDAREGGADGARAAAASASDADTIVRNFLDTLRGQQLPGAAPASEPAGKAFATLNDLLDPSITVPIVRTATETYVDGLLDYLPPSIIIASANGGGGGDVVPDESPEALRAAKAALSLGVKKSLVEKVLRSPQFHQGLAALTMALRDGGLPSVGLSLGVPLRDGGYRKGTSAPVVGGEAVEAFVEGIKSQVQNPGRS